MLLERENIIRTEKIRYEILPYRKLLIHHKANFHRILAKKKFKVTRTDTRKKSL